jgi:hypothetical protein
MATMTEAGMEMEVAEAIKWVDTLDADVLFDLMSRRFISNHMNFSGPRLHVIIERQLKWFE